MAGWPQHRWGSPSASRIVVRPSVYGGSNLRDLGPRPEIITLIKERGLRYSDTPRQLASGRMSHWYINTKKVIARGGDLRLVCRSMIELVGENFDAVGGLTMGADPFAHGIAMELGNSVAWFSVRKNQKEHGDESLVEGADLLPGTKVLLVDDVVTLGGSIQKAYREIARCRSQIVGAVTLTDRGRSASAFFAERGVPYRSLATYHDLGIPAIEDEQVSEAV